MAVRRAPFIQHDVRNTAVRTNGSARRSAHKTKRDRVVGSSVIAIALGDLEGWTVGRNAGEQAFSGRTKGRALFPPKWGARSEMKPSARDRRENEK